MTRFEFRLFLLLDIGGGLNLETGRRSRRTNRLPAEPIEPLFASMNANVDLLKVRLNSRQVLGLQPALRRVERRGAGNLPKRLGNLVRTAGFTRQQGHPQLIRRGTAVGIVGQ